MTNATPIPNELATAPTWAIDMYNALPCGASYDDMARVSSMSRGHFANIHSKGKGPDGSFLLGRKRLFPRLQVVLWMLANAEAKAGA